MVGLPWKRSWFHQWSQAAVATSTVRSSSTDQVDELGRVEAVLGLDEGVVM